MEIKVSVYSTKNSLNLISTVATSQPRHVSAYKNIFRQFRGHFICKAKQPVRFLTNAAYKIPLIYRHNKTLLYTV